jgi:hypothetical protein
MGEDKDGGDVDNAGDGLSSRAIPKPASILDSLLKLVTIT